MHRGIEQGFRHAKVAGKKAGEVERTQLGIRHGRNPLVAHPCECDMCSSIATAEIITRSGVMKACPECARIELGNIRIQIIINGERYEQQA